jgi:uncharacterized protein YjiS (DUF1127 family)
MTNNHGVGLFATIAEMVRTWRERGHTRRELTQWSERDFRDAGLSREEVLYEAGKPFWRA